MPDDSEASADNITRLLNHLKEDSLAAPLVEAYRSSPDPKAAISQLVDNLVTDVGDVRGLLEIGGGCNLIGERKTEKRRLAGRR